MRFLLPIAGRTPFFPSEDFPFPRPLIEIAGRSMIEHVVTNLKRIDPDGEFIFVALQEEVSRYSYKEIFEIVTSGRSETVALKASTAGALCSCLLAIDHIDQDEPLLIANSDQLIDADISHLIRSFETSDADAGVITFDSTHPRWSYVKIDDGWVTAASEKQVISRTAIAGLYYFRRGSDFVEAAKRCILADDSRDGVFYIAPSLNQLILEGKRVAAAQIAADDYHSFYLPSRLEAYERALEMKAFRRPADRLPVQVVIPAAGEGSRFAREGWKAPKPFIDVTGTLMVEKVLDNLALPGSRATILLREDHLLTFPEAHIRLSAQNIRIAPVDRLTEGTACTVLLARDILDKEAPLLIANSDQIVNFSCEEFISDAESRNLDGSILVFRDKFMNPKWSFARLGDNGMVVEVAEKRAISDLATVGIYYFRRFQSFMDAAVDMIARNERVNGEFYTCPVYNYMISSGLRVGVYEIEQSAMNGIGTPEDLTAYLERIGAPSSTDRPT